MPNSKRATLAMLILFGLGPLACGNGMSTLDQSSLEKVRNYQSALTLMTPCPVPSHVADAGIKIWASADAVSAYGQIDPNATSSSVHIPEGAAIVREVLTPDGRTVTAVTGIVQGPPGYNAAVGDLWFAELTPQGAPVPESSGPLYGQLEGCAACHSGRASTAYLFGVAWADAGTGALTSCP